MCRRRTLGSSCPSDISVLFGGGRRHGANTVTRLELFIKFLAHLWERGSQTGDADRSSFWQVAERTGGLKSCPAHWTVRIRIATSQGRVVDKHHFPLFSLGLRVLIKQAILAFRTGLRSQHTPEEMNSIHQKARYETKLQNGHIFYRNTKDLCPLIDSLSFFLSKSFTVIQ